ncbi:MAG: hypothetical protein EOP88_21515 [Verrucomicrobiaceae bacterium]|nr:MAG: hypothetical protein EOP88_21515 [Verrucomicrobiaceae bacterium]
MFSKFLFDRHSPNTREAVRAAFPAELEADVDWVLNQLGVARHEPQDEVMLRLADGGEAAIPYRVYFPEKSPAGSHPHTTARKAILAAILTRHHSGFQRQTWARELAAFPLPWATPFMALLLDDYVCQIPAMLEKSLDEEWIPLLKQFGEGNPEWRATFNSRTVSYWAEFYRQPFLWFDDYPGYRAAVRFGLWNGKTCHRLLTRTRRMKNKR